MSLNKILYKLAKMKNLDHENIAIILIQYLILMIYFIIDLL